MECGHWEWSPGIIKDMDQRGLIQDPGAILHMTQSVQSSAANPSEFVDRSIARIEEVLP